ncbi:MAG: hydantoinase/carbamoylase family amidase [Janthinobacterium lividum]
MSAIGTRPQADAGRLWDRLMRLAEIGALPGGGVDRQALTAGEAEAWRLVLGWAEQGGLQPSADPAGNLFLTLPGRDRRLPPILAGSHLDTQPTGGKFDGAFGTLAALEATLALAACPGPPARDVVVVAWMNEEGSRFAPSIMGSATFAGARDLAATRAVQDADGISVGQALDGLLASFPGLPRRALGFTPGFYLEPHIEQGPELERRGAEIGVVTGIQGKTTWAITLAGEEGHAGTLPMAERRDALAAFAGMAHAMHAGIGGIDAAIRFTIGRIEVSPNAPSVVPARVVFRVDLRHPDNTVLAAAGERVEALARQHAGPCALDVARLSHAASNGFDPALRDSIAGAARARGLAWLPILSAAGHDARYLAPLCPSAMIFIPCRDGVSHAEHEWAEPAHVAAGLRVLTDVMWGLAFPGEP